MKPKEKQSALTTESEKRSQSTSFSLPPLLQLNSGVRGELLVVCGSLATTALPDRVVLVCGRTSQHTAEVQPVGKTLRHVQARNETIVACAEKTIREHKELRLRTHLSKRRSCTLPAAPSRATHASTSSPVVHVPVRSRSQPVKGERRQRKR